MDYCLTHGRQHYPGETDDVDLLGDDLECREVEWPVVAGEVTRSRSLKGTDTTTYYTLGDGDLAYLDNRPGAGLVPVKVLSIEPTEGEHVMWHQANLRVTAGRPGFTRGEVLEVSLPNPALLARDTVYTSRGQVSILGPTRFITPEGELL